MVSIYTSPKWFCLVNPFPKQARVFMCLQYKPIENTVGKGEIARNEQFLLFPQCFLPICRTFCHFHPIWNCRMQTLSVWFSLKFVVLERDKSEMLGMVGEVGPNSFQVTYQLWLQVAYTLELCFYAFIDSMCTVVFWHTNFLFIAGKGILLFLTHCE